MKTPIHIEFSAVYPTSKGYNVEVNVVKSAPILDGTYVLHFAVTESNIAYEWENQDELNFVERTMLPDAYGTIIDLINNDQVTLEFDIDTDFEWDVENLEVVAFIQNLYDKEIINAYNDHLLTVGSADNILSDEDGPSVFPNPASDVVNINVNIAENETFVQISVYDTKGRLMTRPVSANLDKGNHTLQWRPDKSLPQGLYLVKIMVNNRLFSEKVFIH